MACIAQRKHQLWSWMLASWYLDWFYWTWCAVRFSLQTVKKFALNLIDLEGKRYYNYFCNLPDLTLLCTFCEGSEGILLAGRQPYFSLYRLAERWCWLLFNRVLEDAWNKSYRKRVGENFVYWYCLPYSQIRQGDLETNRTPVKLFFLSFFIKGWIC